MIEILSSLILLAILIGICIRIYIRYIRPILIETETKEFERKANYNKQKLEAGYNWYEWRAYIKWNHYWAGEYDYTSYDYWNGADYFKNENDLRDWLKSCGWTLSWYRKN